MAAVPTIPAFSDGIFNATVLNQLADAVAFLQTPPLCQVRQTVAQTVTTSTWTAVTFTSEDVDSDPSGAGGHDNSTNTSRFTAQYAGWYDVGGGVPWASNVTGIRGARWAVNGTAVNGSALLISAASTNVVVAARDMAVYLNVGDYVEIQCFQSSGGNLATIITSDSQGSMTVEWASS